MENYWPGHDGEYEEVTKLGGTYCGTYGPEDMVPWIKEGKVKCREDFTDGLENAPRELIGLLRGENFGKKIIRVGAVPGLK